MIELKDVSFGYGKAPAVRHLSCRVENGQVTALIGPNGAGKTTTLRLMAGILRPDSGEALVDETPVGLYKPKALARQLAFLPQSRPVPAISVRSLVGLGRFAHGKNDERAVENAIRQAGLEQLAERDVRSLSGGQRQMAYLAMLLAQGSPNVLLDEPLTHLDIGCQLDVIDLIRQMKESGKCVAVVAHDLSLLPSLCDRVILLSGGEKVFDGPTAECLSGKQLEEAFQVRIVEKKGISFEKR